ncbi:MAG TPA: zinc-dependent metalloprotease family protein, partial [Pyrinomonadaceae bacterium]
MERDSRQKRAGSPATLRRLSARTVRLILLSLCLLVFAAGMILLPGRPSKAQQESAQALNDQVWRKIDERSIVSQGQRLIVPTAYQTVRLDKAALTQLLARAPMEFTAAAKSDPLTMSLPMPDGTFAKFRVEESPIMEPGLAAQYPDFKTYRGQGIDDPTATTRFGITSAGFHAIILSAGDTVYVDPYSKSDTVNHISYFKRNLPGDKRFECKVGDFQSGAGSKLAGQDAVIAPSVTSAGTLRTYRLALAATGEYTMHFSELTDTDEVKKDKAFAALTATINRVNGVYERELSVHMTFINQERSIIYTNLATDPYPTDPVGLTMINVNQVNLDAPPPAGPVGEGNYDIGHVVSTGFGGVAYLASVCDRQDPDIPGDGFNAGGFTGLDEPSGDGFDIDFVAHEMGHQFGGNHTFNGQDGSCSGVNREAAAAYEPGSATTIQGYAGICGTQDLQPHSDDYFHVKSLEEMVAFTANGGSIGNSCDTETAVDNVAPEVNAGADYTIPKETPFTLTATGTDANGDTLTYTWEEYDLGAASAAGSNTDNDNSGQARPIFRSYKGTTDPTRTFPSLKYILNYANNPPAIYDCGRTTTPVGGEPVSDPCITGEDMPSIERTMKFQVTARDYRAVGGGIDTDLMQVSVKDSAGPFVITAPNTAVTWDGGSTQTVTWNVANTDAAPISCANVRIQLSTDGGTNFSTILESTPNDGSETINVPAAPTTTARIKVQAVDNIFFDISNANFTITGSSPSAYHAPYDFDGDGKSDLSHFRGSEGLWDIVASGDTGGSHVQRSWGSTSLGDRIVPADYDGDGKTDFAVYRNGTWYISKNTGGDLTFVWGASSDIPV